MKADYKANTLKVDQVLKQNICGITIKTPIDYNYQEKMCLKP